MHVDLEETYQPHSMEVVFSLIFQPNRQPYPNDNRKDVLEDQAITHSEFLLDDEQAFGKAENEGSKDPHVVLQGNHLVETNKGIDCQEVKVKC